MCKHHLRALLIFQARPWCHQLPTAGTEAGVALAKLPVCSCVSGGRSVIGLLVDHLLVTLSALWWPECPAQHFLDVKPQQLLGQRGPGLTQTSLALNCAPGRGAWG